MYYDVLVFFDSRFSLECSSSNVGLEISSLKALKERSKLQEPSVWRDMDICRGIGL